MRFETFRSQIGKLLLRLEEVDGDFSFLHYLLNKKYLSAMFFALGLKVLFPVTCNADALSM